MSFKPGDALTGTVNQEGKVTIKVGDHDVTYVPESDLLSVKSGSEATQQKVVELTNQVNDLTGKLSNEHSALVQAQADLSGISSKYADYDTIKSQIVEKDNQIATLTQGSTNLEGKLTSAYRTILTTINPNIQLDQLKDKNIAGLESLIEAARLFGNKRVPVFENGDGNHNPANTKSLRDIINEAKTKK